MNIIEFALSLGLTLSPYQETLLRCAYGLPLTPEQEEIARSAAGLSDLTPRSYRTISVLAGRRSGKSLIAALILAFESCVAKHEVSPDDAPVCLLVAPSKLQARNTGRRALNLIRRSKLKSLLVGKPTTGTEFVFSLRNGIEVRALSAIPDLLRGYKYIVAVLEEAAFFSDDSTQQKNDAEIVAAVQPGLDTPTSKMIRISSPDTNSGVMADDLRHRAERPDVLCWKASTTKMNPGHDAEGQRLMRERDETRWRVEYEAEFAEESSALIPSEHVDRAVRPDVSEFPPQDEHDYVCCIDPSQRNDWFAFAITHRDGDRVQVDHVKYWRREKGQQYVDVNAAMEHVMDMMGLYGITKAYSDQVGAAFIAQILAKRGLDFEHVFTAGTKAAEKFDTARRKFLENNVTLPDVPALTLQLKKLRDIRLGAGRRSVGATTGHDDVAVAACAAIHLAATQEVAEPWIEVIHVPPRGRRDFFDDDGTRWTPL